LSKIQEEESEDVITSMAIRKSEFFNELPQKAVSNRLSIANS